MTAMHRILTGGVLLLVVASSSLVAADYPLTGANTTITFVGTKPGGKHEGGFKSVTGTATIPGDDFTGLKIGLEIDVESLYSDNPKLTAHLKAPDFFGVKSNPKASFTSTKVEKAGNDYKVTGDLTMCGKTKTISFPAQIELQGGMLSLKSKFSIDRTEWGMTYGRGKIDDAVSLTVSVSAKK